MPRLRAEHVKPDLVSVHDVPLTVSTMLRPRRNARHALEFTGSPQLLRRTTADVAVRCVRRVGGVGSADVRPALPVAAVGEAHVDDAVVANGTSEVVGKWSSACHKTHIDQQERFKLSSSSGKPWQAHMVGFMR